MILNDTTNKTGIIQSIERKINMGDGYISGNTDRLTEIKAMVNTELSKVWHLIFMSSGNWQFDDSNQTDLPYGTIDIQDGVNEYSLPEDCLTVRRVEVYDGTNWRLLKPITLEEIPVSLDEYVLNEGFPAYYRLVGHKIQLFPTPNFDSTDGLKVYFDREFLTLDADDDEPGFASPYHEIIPLGVAIEWLKIKVPTSPNLGLYLADYQKLEEAISDFYRNRFKDYKVIMKRKKEHWR